MTILSLFFLLGTTSLIVAGLIAIGWLVWTGLRELDPSPLSRAGQQLRGLEASRRLQETAWAAEREMYEEALRRRAPTS